MYEYPPNNLLSVIFFARGSVLSQLFFQTVLGPFRLMEGSNASMCQPGFQSSVGSHQRPKGENWDWPSPQSLYHPLCLACQHFTKTCGRSLQELKVHTALIYVIDGSIFLHRAELSGLFLEYQWIWDSRNKKVAHRLLLLSSQANCFPSSLQSKFPQGCVSLILRSAENGCRAVTT